MQRVRLLQPVVQERVDALVTRFTEYRNSVKVIQLNYAFAALANGQFMKDI